MSLFLAFGFVYAAAQHEAQPPVGGDLSLYSRYVWRGLVFDEDPVLQADFWMQARGVTMTFWGNMDLTDQDGEFQGQFNEWDTFIDFSLWNCGPVTFGGGLYYLNFPSSSGGQGSSTAEVAATIAGDVLYSPTLTVYWDIWQYHGIYANLNLFHGIELGPGDLSISSSFGWGDDNHNVQSNVSEAGGWLDFQANIEYSIPVHRMLSLTPAVHYSTILQDNIRSSYDKNSIDPDGFFFSLCANMAISP